MLFVQTTQTPSFGISKEFEFLAFMDINSQLQFENLNNTNKSTVVEFRIPNTNIYIELKSRTYKSTAFATTYFDKAKIDRRSTNKQLSTAIIFIAFAFEDGAHYFIRYSEVSFSSF